MKPADLPLDEPLLPQPLLIVLRFEELVLDQTQPVLLGVDPLTGSPAGCLKIPHVALERRDTLRHSAQQGLSGRHCLGSTPEQLRATDFAQLAQGVAGLVQQAVLVALARQGLKRRIERPQLPCQGVEPLLLLAEFREQRLLVLLLLTVSGLTVGGLLILRHLWILQHLPILRCYRIHAVTLRWEWVTVAGANRR